MAAKPSRGSGAACAGRSSCSASTRSATSAICSSRSRKDPAMLVWLDGHTNTQRAAAGELRPRDHGAVHDGRRPLHRARRLRRRARVHRLEPARVPGSAGGRLAALPVRLQRRASTTPAAKTFSFPIYADGSKTIPARAAADGMQDGLDLIDALAAQPRDAAIPWPEALPLLRLGRCGDVPDVVPRQPVVGVLPQQLRHARPSCARCCTSREFSAARTTCSRATRGRSSSSSARSRKSAGTASR